MHKAVRLRLPARFSRRVFWICAVYCRGSSIMESMVRTNNMQPPTIALPRSLWEPDTENGIVTAKITIAKMMTMVLSVPWVETKECSGLMMSSSFCSWVPGWSSGIDEVSGVLG